jgi:transcriptional accessory protein Tex/SPT6
MTHAEQIASKLSVKPSQVSAVVNLLDDGNTVPLFKQSIDGLVRFPQYSI